jgi:hypothetical protein
MEGLIENSDPVPKPNVKAHVTQTLPMPMQHATYESKPALPVKVEEEYEISDEIVTDYDALQFSVQQDEDYSYSEQQQFSNLVKTADGKYACDRCDYKAKQGCHLKAHILGKHEGIKFKCDHCDLQFSSKTNLQKHKYTKHEGKVYSCKECSFETTSSATLSIHKSRDHKLIF